MNERLRVCLLAYEVWPYSAEGELAEIVAGLSRSLIRQGIDLKVFSPCHASVAEATPLRKVDDLDSFRLGSTDYRGSIWNDPASPHHYFIDENVLFSRRGIYRKPDTGEPYPDEFERLVFFVQGSLAALRRIGWQPHVVHCQDWPTALAPACLRLRLMGDPFYNSVATLLTIHNVFFQGRFSPDKYSLTGLPPELFYPLSPFEYFGDLNLLKAGVCYADAVTTVSPQYAREIRTEELGGGLHEVFRMREADLVGILNGIDLDVWDPRTDHLLVARFDKERALDNEANKRSLQVLAGLEESSLPLVGVVIHEPDSQGADLFLRAWPELRRQAQWLLVGKPGQQSYPWQRLADESGGHLAFRSWSSNTNLHRFHAGCDMLLMPSRVEPCGLHQFFAMRYGSVPVVRFCGGLRDSIRPYGESERANGFGFFAYETNDLIRTVEQAIRIWKDDRETWRGLVHNAMDLDYSWCETARQYIDLYQRLTHRG